MCFQHDHGGYAKSSSSEERIGQLEADNKGAKRKLYNANRMEKGLRKKVTTMKEVLKNHMKENEELEEKLAKFDG